MKKPILALALVLILGTVHAAAPAGKDAAAKSDPYGSTRAEALDSLAILPPPPAFDSVGFLLDRARYEEGLLMRGGERGKMAVLDARFGKIAESMSEAFGIDINETNTPEIFRLIRNLRGPIGEAIRAAKEKYARVRPFVLYNAPTCYPDVEDRLRSSGSYPSGHSTQGWAVALILSEINPARKEIILKRGFEMGQSRVICGCHWQSDVEAGRLLGSAAVAALHASRDFQAQLEKAKAEFADLEKEGRIQ